MAEAHPIKRTCRKYSAEQQQEMVRRYEADEPAPAIAIAMKCPLPTVYIILRRHGVKMRPPGNKPLTADERKRRRRERLRAWRATPTGKRLTKESGKERRSTPQGKAEHATQATRYREKDPERAAAIKRKCRLQQRHKITEEEYQRILVEQGGCCAICGSTKSRKKTHSVSGTERFAVDHDHKDGRTRGLLCFRCNTIIGNLGDTKELVEVWAKTAIEYLSKDTE